MSTDLQVWNPEKISLIQRVIAPSVSKDEFEMFIARCKQTGLDPIARQIYAISRYDKQVGGNKMSIQVSIDGMRLLAERSGKYAGQLGPLFCGPDGKEWCEVWTSNNPPYAAKVGILRSDFQQPLWSVAKYGEYVQTFKDGNPTGLWAKMPDLMLAKCAESLALRRAFPYETSGLYTREEMGQAENDVIEGVVSVAPADQPAQPPQKPLLNGDNSVAFPSTTVAITRGDLYTLGERAGLWSRTSPEKFYMKASEISGRQQSKVNWDMTVEEMGEMAKQIYEQVPAAVTAAN